MHIMRISRLFYLIIQLYLYTLALTAPSTTQPPTGLAPLSLPNLPLNITNAFNLTSPIPVDQLPDPYLYRVPDSTILIVFGGYGNMLNHVDASKAVEQPWIEATIDHRNARTPVGTAERIYMYGSVKFFFRPRPMMTWLMYGLVPEGILKIFQDTLDKETSVTILDDKFEGNVGYGAVSKI
ncbi:hypothetical protein OEA41_008983 [Lepraria neglecta]|uniref:Uncharacterized protein n=1 Tax=Lepraria neglecta TaxID=209136 RepID=A0AAE0DHD2_9LECA|nr:hypothetical protein OEA41_008983 [Lepraria neglecta]